MRRIGNVTAFYSRHDFLSNHYPCEFIVKGVRFNCMESFIMFVKARLFGDLETAEKILQEKDPRWQKALGREVKGFDKGIWMDKIPGYYLTGLKARYAQNSKDLKLLLATGDTLLVEAAEHDDIWGVKMNEMNDDIQYPHKWRGLNLCGQRNQDAREYFKQLNTGNT